MKRKKKDLRAEVIDNIYNATLEQVIQAEIMLEFYTGRDVDDEQKEKDNLKRGQLTTQMTMNQEILDYFETCE